ncbi:MAG: hypothetical protein JST68_04540 [Bacteroidetes bacterium]|nr:hypothetical protein [Bacteroidota bacterium]
MKYYSRAILIILLFGNMLSCTRKPTDYRSFLGGSEKTYPGAVTSISAYPGNARLMLTWHPSPDPSVSRYVVYWNNYADSLVVSASKHNPSDTLSCLVNKLQEYIYTFFIFSYDNAGNKSISTEIDNVRVYGSIYQNNLINRPVNTDTPFIVQANQSDVTLKFLTPDSINIGTVIKYTNSTGTAQQLLLSKDSSSILLKDYKFGTSVTYQSSYIPKRGAIDTFYTKAYDTFPEIFKVVECDKHLFKEIHLPNDIGAGFGTSMSQLWDGSTQPKGYPDIFHTDGSQNMPQHFSFDLGATYNHLIRMQEIGRNCCHNPIDFEVWGIADTTGAATTLPATDPGWKNESISKGWTLLKEVIRSDDGIAPVNADLIASPPPVRFIRIRIIKTTDDPNYANLSQLTFWNKE